MHTCPTCGKKMATAGGLEIHEQLSHAAPKPAAAGPDLEVVPVASAARVADVPPVVRPHRTSSGSGAGVLAMAIAILLLAGVASAIVRSRGASALSLVQSAAAATTDAKTARVSTSIKTDSGPLANGITVDGGFDFANRRGALVFDGARFGVPEMGKLESIFDYSSGLVVYLHFPPEAAKELDGKSWVKLDVTSLMRQAGMDVDISSLLQGQSNDPTSGLAMLRGVDNVVKLGPEQVRGVETTHYRADVSIDKAIADAPTPEARDALSKLANLYTVRNIPVEVWLDGEGRLRRYQESLDTGTIRLPPALRTQGNPLQGHVTISYELYDFGAAVDTALPPANQVIDFPDLLKQL